MGGNVTVIVDDSDFIFEEYTSIESNRIFSEDQGGKGPSKMRTRHGVSGWPGLYCIISAPPGSRVFTQGDNKKEIKQTSREHISVPVYILGEGTYDMTK